jgi:predicted nucleic acid-binding protein
VSDYIIVDTDILIDIGRGENSAIEYLENLNDEIGVAISAVTEMELIVGCQNKTELRSMDRFLRRFEILKLNERISDEAAALLREYRLSHGLLIADAIIAATAIIYNFSFVSKNQKDYRFIEKLDLISYP